MGVASELPQCGGTCHKETARRRVGQVQMSLSRFSEGIRGFLIELADGCRV